MLSELWFYLWFFPALWWLLTEVLDARAWRGPNLLFAVLGAALWPLMIPLALWVGFNPKKAERIRQRYGTARARSQGAGHE